jgi:tungstate transport system ATP-binding protein
MPATERQAAIGPQMAPAGRWPVSPGARETLIRLEGVCVDYGAHHALVDVDLEVSSGEVIVLTGPNGAGKSTLLRVLGGHAAHAGRRLPARASLRTAMVFQRPFLLRLSARNNLRIALWLADRHLPRAERRARAQAALERVGLAAQADRPAHGLSGGQQQRLALACAWSTRPDLLLLDEPTAGLDAEAVETVEALLVGFARDGMTLVLSSHDPRQVQRLATRVVALDRGRVTP